MFADTHKIISQNVCENTCEKFELSLDKKNFVWGSALPDYHPKYRAKSHYPDQSIDYIVNEITYLIFAGRFIDFHNEIFFGISKKLFSRKLGIISHFLSDFVCRPHYENWTFSDNMIKHVNYERQMKKLAVDFEFQRIDLGEVEYDFDDGGNLRIKDLVRSFVERVLDYYSQETAMKNDLNFAYSISKTVTEFVLETIILYNKEKYMKKAIVFG